ncbi:MAG: hypothetical protein FJ368_00480 [Pelagibacterales bacterium]|nr:hypothetical protein [Pelagibacterales bacterium]
MIKNSTLFILLFLTLFAANQKSEARPIISGISTNEINIDTKFNGTEILLFGAKGDAGDILIAVRGPKKNFLITKKEKFLGIWHNGNRVKLKNSYSYYSFFSNSGDKILENDIAKDLELGGKNLKFYVSGNEESRKNKNEFEMEFVSNLEQQKLYSINGNVIDFLDESLFKVILKFPKNIARGIYNVEIYLLDDNNLVSFQTIPIYVNQVGFSAQILDFAYQEPFLYGLLSVIIALVVGWLANYLFARFVGK